MKRSDSFSPQCAGHLFFGPRKILRLIWLRSGTRFPAAVPPSLSLLFSSLLFDFISFFFFSSLCATWWPDGNPKLISSCLVGSLVGVGHARVYSSTRALHFPGESGGGGEGATPAAGCSHDYNLARIRSTYHTNNSLSNFWLSFECSQTQPDCIMAHSIALGFYTILRKTQWNSFLWASYQSPPPPPTPSLPTSSFLTTVRPLIYGINFLLISLSCTVSFIFYHDRGHLVGGMTTFQINYGTHTRCNLSFETSSFFN